MNHVSSGKKNASPAKKKVASKEAKTAPSVVSPASTDGATDTTTVAPARRSRIAIDTLSTRDIAKLSLLVAALSAVFTWWAASEARDTRLDVMRARVRSEALQQLDEVNSSIALFNCYASVKGVTLQGKKEFDDFMAAQEPKVRAGLNELQTFDEAGIHIYEKALNEGLGASRSQVRAVLLQARENWPEDLLNHVDTVCKMP